MFIKIVNDKHDNDQEWDKAYEEGRQLVREARIRRAEFREELRKRKLIAMAEAIGSTVVFIGIFFGVGIIVLLR